MSAICLGPTMSFAIDALVLAGVGRLSYAKLRLR